MTEVEKQILATLVELETRVQSMGTGQPKPKLLPLFARLEDLSQQLPRDSDPNLRHYLQKKSYAKARLLLEGREQENVRGACG